MGKYRDWAIRRAGQISAMDYAGASAIKLLQDVPPANAGMFTFEEWEAGVSYKQYDIFCYSGNVYFAKQDFVSSSAYPPDAAGVEALYGVRPAPDLDGIYPYIRNMAVIVGMRVRSVKDGRVYICYANATNTLVYDPADVPSIFELDD